MERCRYSEEQIVFALTCAGAGDIGAGSLP